MDKELFELASDLGKYLQTSGNKIAVAESCTGGWIAQAITEVPGSSAWFDRGFVTYSNLAKVEMLGVKQQTLDNYGAVSFKTAREMVQGVLDNSDADYAVAVTGIAGPDGGTLEKPVGLVFIGGGSRNGFNHINKQVFKGDRNCIRYQTVVFGLSLMLNDFLKKQ